MARARFDRELTVATSPPECWATLTDVPRLVEWVGVVEDAREVAPMARYAATLSDRVGPFHLRADLDIVVTDLDIPLQIAMRATGDDRQVGSRLHIEGVMTLIPQKPSGTVIKISGTYEVTGRVAAMGSGLINKKAQGILGEFFDKAAAELGAT